MLLYCAIHRRVEDHIPLLVVRDTHSFTSGVAAVCYPCVPRSVDSPTLIYYFAGCDQLVNQTASIVNSPNYPLDYENNGQCQYTVQSLDTDRCVRLFFIAFELPEPDEDGQCHDYVLVCFPFCFEFQTKS